MSILQALELLTLHLWDDVFSRKTRSPWWAHRRRCGSGLATWRLVLLLCWDLQEELQRRQGIAFRKKWSWRIRPGLERLVLNCGWNRQNGCVSRSKLICFVLSHTVKLHPEERRPSRNCVIISLRTPVLARVLLHKTILVTLLFHFDSPHRHPGLTPSVSKTKIRHTPSSLALPVRPVDETCLHGVV